METQEPSSEQHSESMGNPDHMICDVVDYVEACFLKVS